MSIILWQLVGSGMGIPAAIVVAFLYVVSHDKMIFRNLVSLLSETYCITRNDKTKHSGSNTGCGFEFHMNVLGECLSVLFCPV
jgi:hypothetical protein